jgi:uncharacterized protein (TIGR02145 family)
MVIFGGIVANACSDDVASAHNEPKSSGNLEIIEIIEDTSSSNSSSSAYLRSSKTNIYFSNKVERISSSNKTSSSSKAKKASSSSKSIDTSSSFKQSSSTKPQQSSSSSAKSSSSEEPSSSAALRFYDCEEHDCVTMEYLNPDVSYGEFLDKRDDKVYRTIVISNHVWTAQNMDFAIETESTSSWCYDNDPKNCQKYGRFYTWEAAQKVCPEGWHLSSYNEWKELLEEHSCGFEDGHVPTYLCAGNELKAVDTWEEYSERLNAYGFSVIASNRENVNTFFWTSNDSLTSYAMAILFSNSSDKVETGLTQKKQGFSVRCIKGKAE